MKFTTQIEFTGMVFGGDAMGRLPDGRPVFVPFVMAGENAEVEVEDEGQTYCRGKLLRLIQSSPERIEPRCPHFGVCGGCHYQFISYASQTRLKQQIVIDQLKRIGKFDNPPVKEIIPSPGKWNYRNVVQFAVSRSGKPGYQQSNSRQVVEITECSLPSAGINEIWPQLDLDPESGLQRIILREGIESDILLTLEGDSQAAPEFGVDFPISAVYRGEGNEILLSGDPYTVMQIKDQQFRVSAGSFFQVNLPQAEKMVDMVLQALDLRPVDTVLDCYCGVGLFSKFIAPQVRKLVGAELSESACEDFATNLDDFENVELYVGSAQQILPGLKIQPDAVVVDPPRAGLEKPALDAILKMQPGKLVYVSCDPSTLARDVRRFVDKGYSLISATPLDLFPQTYHVETICLLEHLR